MILGIYNKGNLEYVGNCGTGFSAQKQKEILEKLKPLKAEKNPFNRKITLKGRMPNWTKPTIVCEVTFSEWTKTGKMRHPVFKGLRENKDFQK